MIKVCSLALGMLLLCSVASRAEAYQDVVDQGNKAFQQKNYEKALEQYRLAETQIPESPELDYNIAGALAEVGKYEEAIDRYKKALNTSDIALEEQAHYNLGNTYYQSQDYQNAIKSYENALNINPDDMDAKFNLELARKMLKENAKRQKQDQQQQSEQKQQKQQQKKDQGQSQNQNDEQKSDSTQQNQQQSKQQQGQKQDKEKKSMSKEDAERILNALKDDESDMQKRIRRDQQGAGEYIGKDW